LTLIFRPTPEQAGLRLDLYLAAAISDVSRVRVQQLIDKGKVHVNGKVQRSSYRLRGDEVIDVLGPPQPPPLNAIAEDIPLDVVYEDDWLAVINKPAGMMVHAGAGVSSADDDPEADRDPRTHGTLVNALLHRFEKLSRQGGELRPGIVHRLDKDTSGLIIVAKSDAAHRKVAEQFAGRQVRKIYLALVHGWPKQASGTVKTPIGRDPVRRNRMSTRARDGRDAVSHYNVLRSLNTPYGKFALLEVRIETGRTHQIRVHLASIGHPVVGDQLYGAPRTLAVLDAARRRAQPAHTKATRDREASERARRLTEAAMGESSSHRRRPQASTSAADPNQFRALPPLSLDRHFLHAASLELRHPRTGKDLLFKSDLPQELSSFLERLEHLS
jgi:23S rRNA pseudouridine1911/1915/1917 synthase